MTHATENAKTATAPSFAESEGIALLWEAVALAKVVEGKVLLANKEHLDAAFSRAGDYFDGEDMAGLCTALRKKVDEIRKIAEDTE